MSKANLLDASGTVLKAGWVKRQVTKMVIGTGWQSAHLVLYSDPLLNLYDDEAHTKHKASYKLTRATTIHCKDATDVVISIPETNQTVKLKALDVSEGMAWRTALANVIQRAFGNSQSQLRSPSKQALLDKQTSKSFKSVPEGEDEDEDTPVIVKQLRRASKVQSTGQLMGGVELGGGLPPPPADDDSDDEDAPVEFDSTGRRRNSSVGVPPPPTSRAFSSKLLNAFSQKMAEGQSDVQKSRVSLSNGAPAKATNELLEAVGVMEVVRTAKVPTGGIGREEDDAAPKKASATDDLLQAIFAMDGTFIDLTEGLKQEVGGSGGGAASSASSLMSAVAELESSAHEDVRIRGDVGGRGVALDEAEAAQVAAQAFVSGSATSQLFDAVAMLEAAAFIKAPTDAPGGGGGGGADGLGLVFLDESDPFGLGGDDDEEDDDVAAALATERRVFEKYDMDSSGDIDMDELKHALWDLGLVTDTMQASAVMAKYDVDRSGALEFGEFTRLVRELKTFKESKSGSATASILRAVAQMEAVTSGVAPEGAEALHASSTALLQAVAAMEAAASAPPTAKPPPAVEEDAEDNPHAIAQWETFRKYDTNSSGDIDKHELFAALRDLGLQTDTAQAAALLKKYDADGSGGLDLGEFTRLVKELRAFQRLNATTRLLQAVASMEADHASSSAEQAMAMLLGSGGGGGVGGGIGGGGGGGEGGGGAHGKKRRGTVSAVQALNEAVASMDKADTGGGYRRTRAESVLPPPQPKGVLPPFSWPEGEAVVKRTFVNNETAFSMGLLWFSLSVEEEDHGGRRPKGSKVITRGPLYTGTPESMENGTLHHVELDASALGSGNPVVVDSKGVVTSVKGIEETVVSAIIKNFGASADVGAMKTLYPETMLVNNATQQWMEWGIAYKEGAVSTRPPMEVECRGRTAMSYAIRYDLSSWAQMEPVQKAQEERAKNMQLDENPFAGLVDMLDESMFPPKEFHVTLLLDKETKRPLQMTRHFITSMEGVMGLSSIGPTFDPEERAAQGLPFRRGMCSIETLQDEFYWEGGFPPPEADDGTVLTHTRTFYDDQDLFMDNFHELTAAWKPLGVHPYFMKNAYNEINSDDDGEGFFAVELTDPA